MERNDLIKVIKDWVKIDNEIRTLQMEITKRKAEKKKVSTRLMEIMKQNQIDCFDTNDGQILYKKKQVKKAITKKHLLNILNTFYQGDTEKAEGLNTFIMENRVVAVTESIVRKVDSDYKGVSDTK